MKKFLLFAAAILAFACTKTPNNETPTTKDCNLRGFAQKGQFVKGSQVTAFAVGEDLVATGESFPANISDDLGAFAISGKTTAPYLELRAEGYYFNELTGEISSNALYLEAFVKSDDQKANINLLTTAIRPRVKKLIKDGKSYDAAVSQAQSELLSSLGFTGNAGNFDDMDITGTSDADGMLLAFACLIQQDRSASGVTTIIQEIASDLEEDGVLNTGTVDEIKENSRYIRPFDVIRNLATYYNEKNLSISTVPLFFKYLETGFNGKFQVVNEVYTSITGPLTNPDAVGGSYYVLSTVDFTVTSDVPDVEIKTEHILGPAYEVAWFIPDNNSQNERTTTFSFKSSDGELLQQTSLTQGANAQYLLISYGTQTKTDVTIGGDDSDNPFQEGAELSVNGREYKIEHLDMFGGELGVKVTPAESFLISYPANAISSAGHIAKVKTSIAQNQSDGQEMYYYGALAPWNDIQVGNPAVVRMQPCFAMIGIRFKSSNGKSVQITANDSDAILSGTASFVVSENDKAYFYDLDPNIEKGDDAKNVIYANYDAKSEYIWLKTFPQTLDNGFKVRVVMEENGADAEKEMSVDRQIQLIAGTKLLFSL